VLNVTEHADSVECSLLTCYRCSTAKPQQLTSGIIETSHVRRHLSCWFLAVWKQSTSG